MELFRKEWEQAQQKELGDLSERPRVNCKGWRIDDKIFQDMDQLMVKAWEQSANWRLN